MESIQVESFLQATKVSVDCIPLISLECDAEMFVRVFLVHGRTGKMHIVTKFSTRLINHYHVTMNRDLTLTRPGSRAGRSKPGRYPKYDRSGRSQAPKHRTESV